MVLDILLVLLVVLVIAGGLGVIARRQPRRPIGASPDETGEVRAVLSAGDRRGLERSLEGALKRSSSRFKELRGRLGGLERDTVLQTMEITLLESDLGPTLVAQVLDEVRRSSSRGSSESELWETLRRALRGRLLDADRSIAVADSLPTVVLVVGVNGAGKTTTVGKLAAFLGDRGEVVIAAADTFRAAATEQVATWASRAGVRVVSGQPGADPGAVVFDAIEHARAHGAAVVLCDTAGRLQTKTNLMAELGKIRRVAEKAAGHVDEVLLVVDATTGQNGLSQARVFGEVAGVTGVVLTKLDGSAKGGVALAIEHAFGVPIKLVGIGEGVDDLAPFDPDRFVDGLLGLGDTDGSSEPGVMEGGEHV